MLLPFRQETGKNRNYRKIQSLILLMYYNLTGPDNKTPPSCLAPKPATAVWLREWVRDAGVVVQSLHTLT